MAPEESILSVDASFEHIGTAEEATSEGSVTPLNQTPDRHQVHDEEAVDDRLSGTPNNKNEPGPRQRTGENGRARLFEDPTKPAEDAWVPDNDIHFVLNWEGASGDSLKESRSLMPFPLPGERRYSRTRLNGRVLDDSYSDNELYAQSLGHENVQTTADENDDGFARDQGPHKPLDPTGIPVFEFCTTLDVNQLMSRPRYGIDWSPRADGATRALGRRAEYRVETAIIRDKTVRIHSPHLINALRAIADYPPPGIDLNTTPVLIPSYSCYLAHVYRDLRAYKTKQMSIHDEEYATTTAKHIDLLVNVLEKHYGPLVAESNLLAEKGLTKFETVWNLFKPGAEAYFGNDYENRSTEPCIIHSIYPTPDYNFFDDCHVSPYDVEVWWMTWKDGRFERRWETFTIQNFIGQAKICKLPVFPASFRPREDDSQTDYQHEVLSGRFCWEMAAKGGPCYLELTKCYHEISSTPREFSYPFSMMKRFVVDYFYDFSLFPRRYREPPSEDSLDRSSPYRPNAYLDRSPARYKTTKYTPGCQCDQCVAGPAVGRRSRWFDIDNLDPRKDDMPDNDAYFFSMDKFMPGFVFTGAGSVSIHARHVKIPDPLPRKAETVYTPPGITEAIGGIKKSLEASSTVYRTKNNVQVHGGTQGGYCGEPGIILLHGPPGTGKTATVEQLAEAAQRPLFYLNMTLSSIMYCENTIGPFLHFCERVGGIALIDDADKVLGRRMKGMHDFNMIFSTIVQTLDTFRGTMFLTTNRLGHIDPAFLCRVNTALHFPALTNDQRQKIWLNQFAALDQRRQEQESRVFISPETRAFVLESKEVAGLEWNGIEIRHALRSAVSLAKREAPAQSVSSSGEHQVRYAGLNEEGDGDAHGAEEKPDVVIVLEKHFRAVVKNALTLKEHFKVAMIADGPTSNGMESQASQEW